MPYAPTSDHAFRRSLARSRARRAAAARRSWARFRARSGAIVLVAATAGLAGGALAHEPPTQAASAHGGEEALARVPDHAVTPPAPAPAPARWEADETSASPALAQRKADEKSASPALARRKTDEKTASPTLEAIAACESGGDPAAVSADGAYRGKYQFSYETWAAMGASGDPAAASEAEQDRRAAALMAQAGTSPWPACA